MYGRSKRVISGSLGLYLESSVAKFKARGLTQSQSVL